MTRAHRLFWVDLETTGLDLADDYLLEVAVVITGGDLDELWHDSWVVQPPDNGWKARLDGNAFVYELHERNGLVADLEGGKGVPVAHVSDEISDALPRLGADGAVVAGSSVRFDRAVLDRDLPKVAEQLHYRTVDVSSLKELCRMWQPTTMEDATPVEAKTHRALDDIRASIEELRTYRRALFGG